MSIHDVEVDFTKRSVRVSFQVAAPTSFDLNDPLVASSLINPRSGLTLMEQVDEIDPMALESLRATWIQALNTERDDLARRAVRRDRKQTNPVVAALAEISSHLDKQGLAAWVQAAKFPVPDNYTIALPAEGDNMRRSIIYDLVPFRETREMLMRLETTLELPMRVLQITNGPVVKGRSAGITYG